MAKDKLLLDERFEVSEFGPPEGKGVYAICVMKMVYNEPANQYVVYIGSSDNIRKRLMSSKHPYRRLYNILKNYNVSCFYYECDNHRETEIELIKQYNPRFNCTYNRFKTH